MNSFKLLLMSFFICSCSLAPLTEPHTARTLGKNNSEIAFTGGYIPHASVSYKYGISDNFDLGGVFEIQHLGFPSLLLGVDAKYMLPTAVPISLIVGVGKGSSSAYVYAGPIVSYLVTPQYEMAFNLRYNYFHWDLDDDIKSDEPNTDLFNSALETLDGGYQYISFDFSNTYMFKPNWGLTLSASALRFLLEDADIGFKGSLKAHYKF